ncbi:MAG: efflux RND transporter periplasmic adaptor subunit [Pseudomonadota bacterium]
MDPHAHDADDVGASTQVQTAAPRGRRPWIWALSTAAALGISWWILGHHAEGAPGRPAGSPLTVVTATVRQLDIPVYLDALGTVTPLQTVLITSQVTGQVMSVHYQEGQLVQQGMPLIDIDARSAEASLLQAQGALDRDSQSLAQARMDLERFRAAWAKNAISKQQLDDQEKLTLQVEGSVKNDRGTVALAKVQLGYCHISAPITGRIGLRLVDPGNVLSTVSGTTLAVITQLKPISVVFTVSEDDLTAVLEQTRQGARLSVEALDRSKSKQLASGELTTIDNQIDTTTGTVKLRARFDNADEALFPNQFVNTRLLLKTIRRATTVPTSAVQHDGNEAFVYVIENGRARAQQVKTGIVESEISQVEGIAPGTVVANSSFEKLENGAFVASSDSAAPRPRARTPVP